MAQPSQIVPTVTLNMAGQKQQVNLRDYLNVRVAPFLKKAIHDSLEAEPQYPLQWLGEHLIEQSIIYEGNPDTTKLRERFLYNHDAAAPKAVSPASAAPQLPSTADQEPTTAAAAAAATSVTTNGIVATPGAEHDGPSENHTQPKDTEMSGTL